MLVIKDTYRLDGKGCKCPEVFLECPAISITDAFLVDYTKHSTVIFHLCEEHPTTAFAALSKVVRSQNPGVRIFNDPSICDIGDKLATFNRIAEEDGIPHVELPAYWTINSLSDAANVLCPCVVRKLRASGGAGMRLAENEVALKRAIQKLGRPPLQAVEYIDTDHDMHASVRINWIGNTLIDFWCRPAGNWNVHVSKMDRAAAVRYDDMFREWLEKRDMNETLRTLNRIFGLGWYSMDAVWAQDKLWFCELGYKVFDHHHERVLRSVPWTVRKRTQSRASVYEAIRWEVFA